MGRTRQSLENIGQKDVNDSIQTGRPLTEYDNPHVASEIQRAVLNDEQTAVNIDSLYDKLKGEQRGQLTGEILDKFGTRSAQEHAETINNLAQAKVRPKYEEVVQSGLVDIGKVDAEALAKMQQELAANKSILSDYAAKIKEDPKWVDIHKIPEFNSAARKAAEQNIADLEARIAAGASGNPAFSNPYVQKIIKELKKTDTFRNVADNDARLLIEVDQRLSDAVHNNIRPLA